MPSNNSKYTEEMREQTAQYIIESGKSATGVAEELGIDKNTVCSWVRAYRRKHNMPTYAEEKGIVPNAPPESKDLALKVKELENKLKEKDKEIKKLTSVVEDERRKVEILKNPCTSSWNQKNEVGRYRAVQVRV